MRFSRLLAAVFAVVIVGATWLPARAATTSVAVVDDAYEPREITVVVGDLVEWRWMGDHPHSVSGLPVFDSHPTCSQATPEACAAKGDDPFTWQADQVGQFNYFCRFHGADVMSGVVTVVASDPAVPSGGASSEPASETESEPPASSEPPSETQNEPSPDPTPSPDPEPEPTPEPQPEPTTETATADAPDVPPPVTFSASESAGVVEPEVAEPSFDAFPEARDPSAPPSQDDLADDEVTVAIPDGGIGAAGLVWRILGSLTVVGTAGVFAKTVLFGPPWNG